MAFFLKSVFAKSLLAPLVAVQLLATACFTPAFASGDEDPARKAYKEKLEEARIKIRNERQRTLNDFDRAESGEDEEKRLKTELRKLVDEINGKLEELVERKEKEILE